MMWADEGSYLEGRSSRVHAQVGAAVQGRTDVSLQQLLWDGPAEEDRAWYLQGFHRICLSCCCCLRWCVYKTFEDAPAGLSHQASGLVGSPPWFLCRWCRGPDPGDNDPWHHQLTPAAREITQKVSTWWAPASRSGRLHDRLHTRHRPVPPKPELQRTLPRIKLITKSFNDQKTGDWCNWTNDKLWLFPDPAMVCYNNQ